MTPLTQMQSERFKAVEAVEQLQTHIEAMDKIAREGDWGEGDVNNLAYARRHLQIADNFIKGVRQNPNLAKVVAEEVQ